MSEEEFNGYELLEYFDDTILFKYNYKNDTIYFTPQINDYLDIKDNHIENISTSIHHYILDDSQKEKFLLLKSSPQQGKLKIQLFTKHQKNIWFELEYRYLYKQKILIGKMINIQNLELKRKKLQYEAERDGLTGVYNRRTLETLIGQRLNKCNQGVIMMMDIDKFKAINDEYGHEYGDRVLKWVAKVIQKLFRKNDLMGRIGGDEFVAFIDDISEEGICMRIHRIEQELSKHPFVMKSLTMSIGVAKFPQDGLSYDVLYQKADEDMYRMKNNNKKNNS